MSDGTLESRSAAAWWVEKFSNKTKADPNDATFVAQVARNLAQQAPPEKIEHFGRALEWLILGRIESQQLGYLSTEPEFSRWTVSVKVDYHPDRLLSGALEEAGLDPSDGMLYLPWKTVMWIDPGRIGVRVDGGDLVDVPLLS